MMYEALLFDMNALGDIPDKDFTSKATLPGSSRVEGRGQRRKPESTSSLEAGTSLSQGGRDQVALVSNLWVLDPTPHTLTSSRV